ncbi:MAG: hypothetical protein KQH57_06795 [Actinomycetales bacterium]|nr:hypothetical protein [Actinomycetales bacterium]
MVIAEVIAAHLVAGGRVLATNAAVGPLMVDLGVDNVESFDAATIGPSDLVVTFVADARAGQDYWPADLPLGSRVIAVVAGGVERSAVPRVLAAADDAGCAVIDAIPISGLGASIHAIVAVRSEVPVAPHPWLTSGFAIPREEKDRSIIYAVGAHVLSRSLEVDRTDRRLAELYLVRSERDALAERVRALSELSPAIAGRGTADVAAMASYDELALAHWRTSRRLEAIYRSRTWRIGRVVWALAHPLAAVRARRRGRPASE